MHRNFTRPRRARSIIAITSGFAIAIAGAGVTALPASAEPDGPADAASTISSPRGSKGGAGSGAPAASAGSPTGSHQVTLITGDRVTLTEFADGKHAVEIDAARPGEGFQTLEIAGEVHVLPESALRFVAADVVDRDLFNVSKLVEYGYDDASVDATPVILELGPPTPTPFSADEPLPGVDVGVPLASIGGTAAAADHAAAEQTWAALTETPDAATEPRAFSETPDDVSLGGGVTAIHLDGKVEATLDESVPWVGADDAWAAGYTGTGVTVAVLDSGYDDTHPDLASRVLPESASFVPGERVGDDPDGHGTHVASTVAGSGAAGGGRHRGVADGASLLIGKVLDQAGYGQDSWIIAGMEWAAERADIVSMSLGSQQASDGTDLMAIALDEIAARTDALFIVAAGNAAAPETIGSPGAAASALTVGSVDDPSGALSWFSSQGPLAGSGALKPEIAGPGNDVTAARSADSGGEGSYASLSGTSMATPHVAGAAAIVKQQHPEYTAAQLRAALLSTATDVGLTAYQAGTGVLDVAEAIDAPILASGSGDFGLLSWGEDPAPIERVIEYTNRSDAELTLDLTTALSDTTSGGSGGEAPADVVTADATELVIPAGETRSVTLTGDPTLVPAGAQLSGMLVASVDGEEVARTALGIIAEPERYDLTLTATGFDGAPATTVAWIWNAERQAIDVAFVEGETTLRMPEGRYSVMSFVDAARTPDTKATVLAGDPDLVLNGDATVAFDARSAKQVTVDVGKDGLAPVVQRMDFNVDGFAGSAYSRADVDEIWAQPMEAPNADRFGFSTRWRLQQPEIALTAGRDKLDLIVHLGSARADGRIRGIAVDVGTGSADEFAAADVRGKIAVATRSDAVTGSERAANAAAAGATLLITVNDADGEFDEWVGSADFAADAAIPVVGVSGVQGRALLERMERREVTLKGVATQNPDELFDIAFDGGGVVPTELDYRPRKLARIDTTYTGEPGLVGEFRYDFMPGRGIAQGFPMRTLRGIERAEWVNTDRVEWYQDATVVDAGWQVRDVLRGYQPGERVEAQYFAPIVRPYVGQGYWSPFRSGDGMQINVPSFADGGEATHTGGFDMFSPTNTADQLVEVFVNGELFNTSESQAVNAFGIPDGESDFRVVNTVSHDGTYLPSSTATRTEWTFASTGYVGEWTEQTLPMLQAFYDVEVDASGVVGVGRSKLKPVPVELEVGHLLGAIGSAEVTSTTLEARIDGTDWQPIELELVSADIDRDDVEAQGFSAGRDLVAAYAAEIEVPKQGGWVDLRVTAEDAAGNTLTQQIDRAFEAAAAKRAGGGSSWPGWPGWPGWPWCGGLLKAI